MTILVLCKKRKVVEHQEKRDVKYYNGI